MKSLLVISGYWPIRGNPISGIFVVQQVKALCDAGYRVTVVLGQTIGKGSNHLGLAELGITSSAARLIVVPILRLPESVSANGPALKLNIFLAGMSTRKALAPLLRGVDGCIVHGIRYFGLATATWSKGYTGRTLLFIHGVDPFLERNGMTSRIEAALRSSDRAIANYVLVGSPLLKHATALGIDPAKLVVIPNGTEIPAFSLDDVARRELGATAIVSVSNLVPLKGIDDNLRALALLRQRHGVDNWTYTVIGDGPERARLQHMAHELRIDEKVRFLGRIPYDDTMREIAEADIFSLPSWREAFGIVYLEAMARFKPAIGCFYNGAADIITDGKDGLLVPPKNPEALAMALRKLLDDPELRLALGKRARQTAEGFTWDINAGRLLELLGLKERDCVLAS